MVTWLILAAGFVLLVIGAEFLVRGAARLAANFGVPTLVIGLTVVAFCTSAPELAVSVKSAYNGQAELAIANVIGSNIFNVLFILGLSAIIVPLVVSQQLIRQDVPIMIGVSILAVLMALFSWCFTVAYISYMVLVATSSLQLNTVQSYQLYYQTRSTLLLELTLKLPTLFFLFGLRGAKKCSLKRRLVTNFFKIPQQQARMRK